LTKFNYIDPDLLFGVLYLYDMIDYYFLMAMGDIVDAHLQPIEEIT